MKLDAPDAPIIEGMGAIGWKGFLLTFLAIALIGMGLYIADSRGI